MHTKFFVNEAFDTGLQAVFEAILAGGDFVVDGTAGEVLVGEKQSVHLGVDGKIVFHGAFGERHFGFVGTLYHAVVTERNDAFVLVDDDTAHLAGGVFGFCRYGLGNVHKVLIPFCLFTHDTIIA